MIEKTDGLSERLKGFKKCEFYENGKLEFFFAYRDTEDNEELFRENIRLIANKVKTVKIEDGHDE